MNTTVKIDFISVLLLVACSIFLIVDTGVMSFGEIILFGDAALAPSLAICVGVVICFAGIAFVQKDLFILAFFGGWLVFYLFYYLYFVIGADRPINFNALGVNYGSFSVVLFFVLAKRALLPATMIIMFYVYASYLFMYSVFAAMNDAGVVFSIISNKATIFIPDPGRGVRIFMHPTAAVYVGMYSIAQLQEKFLIRFVVTLGLSICALYFSMSRGLIICTGAISVLYLLTKKMTVVQYFSFIMYLIIAVYLITGVFDSLFNPYFFDNSDTSVTARSYEYQIAVPYIREYPLLGLGLPDGDEGLTHYLGRVVFPSDLGIVGIWLTLGLVGVFLIGGLCIYLCCFQNIKRSSAVLGQANARTLSLTGCVIGLYAVMANNLLGGAAPLFSLIVANTLYNAALVATMRQTSPHVINAARRSGRLGLHYLL
jgi:hypothetical protein